ncbi:zinc-ribbon domain-containing protein [Afipia felis]|uniref:MJ0042 family finger-like domain n=2 Tax=Afipia felis TaxID=1035 RepID=A0A380W5A2_AFIFE|nr:zinc-ribbon domain-containing protein [Afipia felis]EKS30851.1 MJ0042 family finger-like domain-containing protein [Afipia felis ATCC 53690]SUU75596.1 MJ0042 family finger-like domain [Afipia felis]SUU83663.1 MJ0042 family finger-like domain [Afipia felis]
MQIICPHCTTFYDVDSSKFSAAGRNVRCARCGETWLVKPESASAMAGPDSFEGVDAGWGLAAETPVREDETPHVQSPSIAADWNDEYASHEEADVEEEPRVSRKPEWLQSLLRPLQPMLQAPILTTVTSRLPVVAHARMPKVSLSFISTAMAAVCLGLVIWRADIVRLMPQTGTFFKMAGLGVNLRGLEFDNLRLSSETVNGKPVLVIEGAMKNITRKPVELPRLRFIVRDQNGADIYAWNSVLEQPVLKASERLAFKSRLASPPAEGREIAVRFFQRRDIAAGAS